MIAARTDARRPAKLRWTAEARLSLKELMAFVKRYSTARPRARRQEIERAIQRLRYVPLSGEVVASRGGDRYRRLVVSGRFFVYYLYSPAAGTISIRAVKHCSLERPFFGVRDSHPPQARA